ncbi:conserved hypothetical protein [Thermotomaculum hydrothermale]|uniref:BFN domain-containing protein n=1 Tax=Thermotomaculum hydrothermale TaxID=981385 RepID=A0A7R6SZ25_9BACT|nr:bifunctional nuclease family protein [Thermotomaculum hydrothermale]BBB32312.1 conserved hypothetical protein [Thermotomaculum hydrothermale]
MFVEAELKELIDHPLIDSPVLVLKEKTGQRYLSMKIGLIEANTIANEIEGIIPPRPMPHDLICDLIKRLEAELKGVYIKENQDSIYFAEIKIEKNKQFIAIDSRPSDAITIAIKYKKPIYVNEKLLKIGE